MSRFLSRILSRGFVRTRHAFSMKRFNESNQPMRNSSSQCLDDTNIRMRMAYPEDCDSVMKFMCKTYFKSEPSLVNIGLVCDDEPPEPLLYLMQRQVKEGMTIIAEDTENSVVGAAINAGSCPWEPDDLTKYAECYCDRGPIRDVIKFYAHVTKEPNLWDKYGVMKIFECSYVAVDERYLGLGIGRRLVRESWYLARDCGYQVFRIDCTSIYTARIAKGFSWECVFSMPYRRHIDSGGLVFKCIQEPHTEVQVYVDRPLICKDYCIANPDWCTIRTAPSEK